MRIADDYAGDGDLVDRLVQDELRKLKARARARELLDAERRPPAEPYRMGTLAELLTDRTPTPPARVAGLIPWEASSLVTAVRKTGKTTLILNLARVMCTGERFLGSMDVRRVDGLVAWLNYELSDQMAREWADEAGVPADRFLIVNLRGTRNPLSDPEEAGRFGAALRARGVESLIVDTFTRAFTGRSQNDAGEVGPFLADLERFARTEVGARDLILTAHAGWSADHTRGSSALEDWPDSIITLTKDDAGRRFLRAMGRDVDLEEDALDFDPDTRRLTLTGHGNRQQVADGERYAELVDAVVAVVAEHPGITGYKVAAALKEAGIPQQRGDHSKALALAVADGRLTFEAGPRNSKCYRTTDLPRPTPTYPDRGTSPPTPTTYKGGGVRGVGGGDCDMPRCRVCGQSLHAAVVVDGFDTCPSCEAVAS